MMKIQTILSTKGSDVLTIPVDQTIREAIASMVENNIGSLVVIDEGGKPVGIVTERDIIRRASTNETLFSEQIREVMSREVVFGSLKDDVESVAHTMTERRFRHLPILDEGKLVGIVSIGDVVKAQRDQYLGEVDTLQTQMIED
jgi:CBS domain-containing protein